MTPSLLDRLSAIALEKYPPMYKKGFNGIVDVNKDDRIIYRSGLKAYHERFAREIAEKAYQEGIKSGVSSVEVYCEGRSPYLSAQVEKAEYLAQFPEPKKD